MISFQNKLEQKKITNVQNRQPPTASMALWLCHIYTYNYIYIYPWYPFVPLEIPSLYQVPGGLRGCCPGPSAGGGWIDGNWGGSWGYKVVIAMELPSSHRCPLASHVDPKKTQIYIPDQLFFSWILPVYPYPCIISIYVLSIYLCMHACMHAYIHTYKHACIHTYIQTYIHTVQTDRHTYIYTDTQTYNHTDRHPYRHTYIQTDR